MRADNNRCMIAANMDHPFIDIITAPATEGITEAVEKYGQGFAQCCVTSPPYWSLRDYNTGDCQWRSGWTGELGAEPHPAIYLENIAEVMDSLWDAMRDDGILWLNVGDCYATDELPECDSPYGDFFMGVKARDLCNIPLAMASALRERGWYLRCVLPWVKLQYVPQPIHTRPSLGHEYVLMLTPTDSPWYDSYAVRRKGASQGGASTRLYRSSDMTMDSLRGLLAVEDDFAAVVTPSVSKSGGHKAAFSPWLPRDLILASTCEDGRCSSCGLQPRRATDYRSKTMPTAARVRAAPGKQRGNTPTSSNSSVEVREYSHKSWEPQCSCGGTRIPSVVIDPFCGSGTTGAVAHQLGRSFVGVEIDEKVAESARARVKSGSVSNPAQGRSLGLIDQ